MVLKENEVYVLDNIIPLEYQNYLLKVFSLGYIWGANGLNPKTSTNKFVQKDSKILKNIKDSFQFQHPIWDEFPINKTYADVIPILYHIQESFKFSYKYDILSIKANLKTNNIKDSDGTNFAAPHVDYEDFNPTLWTLLYYINDSDGDTIIFNEKYNGSPLKTFTVNKSISPQKGKCVMFRTNTFHSAGFPLENLGRMVINFNISIYPF